MSERRIYQVYQLSRKISVQGLVSADYFTGLHPYSKMHFHQSAWEICVCMEGSITVTKDGNNVPLEAGELVFIRPQTHHEILSRERNNQVFVIAFTCNGELLRPLQDSVIPITRDMRDIVHKLVYELSAAFQQSEGTLRILKFIPREDAPLGTELMISSYLEQLLVLVLREITMGRGKNVASGQLKDAMQSYLVEQVMAYIREHIKEDLNVSEIAGHFHYSRTHLSVLFKASAGISIVEYILFIRIRLAKQLLIEKKMSIAQIAEETGFSSPQYFSHRFAKEVGCSPTQFLERVSNPENEFSHE